MSNSSLAPTTRSNAPKEALGHVLNILKDEKFVDEMYNKHKMDVELYLSPDEDQFYEIYTKPIPEKENVLQMIRNKYVS